MAGAKKELLKSAFAAIMSALLLAIAVCYFLQPQNAIFTIPLALGDGQQFSENQHSILDGDWLTLDATFSNGTTIAMSRSIADTRQTLTLPGDYSVEFDAAELKTIILSINSFYADLSSDNSLIRALVAFQRDRVVKVTLIDENGRTTDLGASVVLGFVKTIHAGKLDLNQGYYQPILDKLQTSLNVTRLEAHGSGYWRIIDYVWHISIDKLTSMLQGSGKAELTVDSDVTMNLRFRIFKTAGENLTGEADLKWAGTWGTLQLTYQNGCITWVKYKSSLVALVMQQPQALRI